MINVKINKVAYICCLIFLSSCSMTKNIPEDDQLFVGLKPIVYADDPEEPPFEDNLAKAKEEVEAALATKPNGSLFGSSYYTLPWSWHLSVYNHFSGKNSGFAKWMTKTFGTPPVLMSQVNPALHATVAQNVLRNYGYFRGTVDYEPVATGNPKKSRLRYTVHLDSLFLIDSVSYINFPPAMKQLIDSTQEESIIKKGYPFSLVNLDGERTRITNLFRNNGYYYYASNYASYLADTFAIESKSQLRFQLANGLPPEALRKWYIGKIDIEFRKSMREQLNDSLKRRSLTLHFNGKHVPVRPRVLIQNLRIRPRQEFIYDRYVESTSKLNATGVFSNTDFQFTPRPDTDTLDLKLNLVFDKPYDFYIEGNAIGRTNGRYGPELKIGFAKRNLFRGAEKLDVNLHGSYQWQNTSDGHNSNYQYGADVSLEFPRIIAPFYNSDRIRRDKNGRPIRRKFYSAPTTFAKISTDVIYRPEYYKMSVVTGEWTYRWQSSETSRHEFSPLTVKYQFKNSTTWKFDSIQATHLFLWRSMADYFIPKVRYTYTYTSPATYHNPIRWETTIEEASNLVSLFDVLCGRGFNEKGKKLFGTEYSQFLRFETDFTKKWSIGNSSQLVGHVNAGIAWSYGNSKDLPFTEMFYAGGANSIRAFGVRDVGPGRLNDLNLKDRQFNYVFRNGEMKLIANLEYRARLYGNLYGAVFLDAGNVWNLRNILHASDEELAQVTDPSQLGLLAIFDLWGDQAKFKPSEFFNDIALGTGIGLRYDLGFLVLRLDWGIALHSPQERILDEGNTKSGYFNIGSFKDGQTLHFAIGYPF